MGSIEKSGKVRKQRRDFKYAILGLVKASALIGAVVLAPNMPGALEKMGLLPHASKNRSTIGRSRRLLVRQGLLLEKKGLFSLTPRGATVLAILESRYAMKKPSRWDGRWRVLIFDVPEYRKAVRDKIRRTLVHIGFVRLQDSVWAYPYDCEDFVALLKADFKIGKDLIYMIVDELEGDELLRKEFGLKKAV